MIDVIVVGLCCLIAGTIGGYFAGRYHTELLDKIRTLQGQVREPEAKPEKPTITGGAYQPPHEVAPVPDKKRGAGLIETKTPEQLDWENRQELEQMSNGG